MLVKETFVKLNISRQFQEIPEYCNIEKQSFCGLKMQNILSLHKIFVYLFCQKLQSQAVNSSF